MDTLDGHLAKARSSFEDAKGQLSSGRGNVVRQVEMLRELGAKTDKSLAAGWGGGADDAPQLGLVGVEPGGEGIEYEIKRLHGGRVAIDHDAANQCRVCFALGADARNGAALRRERRSQSLRRCRRRMPVRRIVRGMGAARSTSLSGRVGRPAVALALGSLRAPTGA